MTVTIQQRYNWCGQKGKKSLGQLRFAGVVHRKYI